MSDRSLELGTILIVDDMPTNLGSVVEFLSESGFKIWVARSGKSALKKVEYSQPDLGASQFGLKGEFILLAPPSLVGKGAGGLGLFAKLRCSPGLNLVRCTHARNGRL